MFNADDFVKVIKQGAMEAFAASKPANMVFGIVISESPLQIKVDQKLVLNQAQLALSRNVTDHDVDIDIYITPADETYTAADITWKTEEADGHIHDIKGKKKLRILNKLKAGEEVILMRVSNGQKYIVIDRIGKV